MRLPPSFERLKPWWPHLRAAFVAFHLIAIVLAAIPAPAGGMNRRNWKDPTVQQEFEAWGSRLGVDPASLEETVYQLAKAYMSARDAWLAPVEPYLEATGTDQPWRMFVAPHKHPARYRVEVQKTGSPEWELLFEERSPDAQWNRKFFEAERTRSVLFRYAWGEYTSEARQFCQYLSRQLFDERAEVESVRCRYWKAPSPTPEEAEAGTALEGTWAATKTIKRNAPKRVPD